VWPRTPHRRLKVTDDPFVTHRNLLFTVAYEMLGSATDAQDVVQESWLRWADVDQTEVRDARSYLVRIATRQALNRLRLVVRRREDYVGEWLPEPLLTTPDPAEDVELAENVSIAMLTVLETLGSTERAVFVLREVFETPYDEIAEVLGKTPVTVRQIARRARGHVAARRPRMQVDRAQQQAAVDKLILAISTGDVSRLLDVLAPDVVLVADGGGQVAAARNPICGADRVVAFLARASRVPGISAARLSINGMPSIRIDVGGEATAVSLVVDNGHITRLYAMRNPEKLRGLQEVVQLTRCPQPVPAAGPYD
jgi:RNA polymerase sigma-70 factor (TIGR02957 family)